MLEDVAIAISTGAAGNIVANMLNGQVDALRTQVTRIFRNSTEQERSAALRAVEDDTLALTQQKVSEVELTKQWGNSLLSYLTAHPEAREDIESLASSPVTRKSVIIGSQTFQAPGAFGGDNNGTINIYPER
jgi:siroheme synthase (precorrin-2 oxidase/ferrochelatase)